MQEIILFISRHPIISISWICIFLLILITMIKNANNTVKFVTCSEATRLINNNAVMIDFRKNDDFQKGHIAGSINIPISKIENNNNMRKLKKLKENLVIVVDSTGFHTKYAAKILRDMGFKKIFVLKNGISAWNEENLPLIQDK